MNKKQLQALAQELAKDIKTGDDLSVLSAELTKLTVEAALNSELEEHLGYIVFPLEIGTTILAKFQIFLLEVRKVLFYGY